LQLGRLNPVRGAVLVTVPAILLLFGGGLLRIAILGGGFEIHELKVPKVGRGPRILAGVVGALFLLLGISTQEGSNPPSSYQSDRSFSHRIQFYIFDELTSDMIASGQSEQAEILIDGIKRGDIGISKYFAKGQLLIEVENEGSHYCMIKGSAIVLIANLLRTVFCTGDGTIYVTAGSRFLVDA
jgi:hypothetical protein